MRLVPLAALGLALIVLRAPGLAAAEPPSGSPAWAHHVIGSLHAARSLPSGDFNGYYNAGLGGGASIGYAIRKRWIVSVRGELHRFGISDDGGRQATVVPVTVNTGFGLHGEDAQLWLEAGCGWYHIREHGLDGYPGKRHEDAFGVTAGLGLLLPVGSRAGFGPSFRLHATNAQKLYTKPTFLALQMDARFGL